MKASQSKTAPGAGRARAGTNFSGRWRSQSGSEMVLKISDQGELRGSYRSALGTVDPLAEYPLVGWVSGDLLSFTVSFGARGIAAWVGQHAGAASGGQITTLWHLAEDIPDDLEAGWLWYGFKAGADTFARVDV